MNILNFPIAGALGENDFFYIVQNGLDKKATFKQLPLPIKLYTTEIHKNEDLNNYNKEGWYNCPTTESAMTLLNCPIRCAFSLVVNRTTANGWTFKLVSFDPDNPRTFIRNVYNDYWGKWHEISFAQTVSSVSNTLKEPIRLNNKTLPTPANFVPISEEPGGYTQEFAKNTEIQDNANYPVDLDRLTRAVEHLCTKYPDDETLKQILSPEVHTS